MAELDFTALNKIAYRGFETEEQRETKDALTAQGFTILPDEITPFSAPESASSTPPAAGAVKPSSTPGAASDGLKKPFIDVSGKRNYKTLYRAAHDFHRRHHPPIIDRIQAGGAEITPEDDFSQAEVGYWVEVCNDMTETMRAYNNDPFLKAMLEACYSELERQYAELKSTTEV